MDGYGAALTAQSFAYEIRENSAVILRCFSRDGKAEIPEQIGGYPVVELGAYAFSAHFGEAQLEERLRDGKARLCIPETIQGAIPSALCGERLEEIVLPRTLRKVGRYCFYNCENLRRIEFHGGLEDWGSGAFTGCHRVRGLCVYADADGRSHLKDVLDELREELEVEYFISDTEAEQAEEGCRKRIPVRLIFPEYYEEGVENTPARILENHVHGSGILYRNCFQSRLFDFAQYDALFAYAKAWESGEVVSRMALNRLRFSYALGQKAKLQYIEYLTEHAEETGNWLLRQRDLDGVRMLLEIMRERNARTDAVEQKFLEYALRIQYTEAVSCLMEDGRVRHGKAQSSGRRFEL